MRHMTRVRIGAVAMTAIVATLVALATSGREPAGAATRQDCRTRGTTITANASVRVFYTARGIAGEWKRYYACWVARRMTRFIGDQDGWEGGIESKLALAGHTVAYEEIYCDRDTGCDGEVRTFDVRDSGRDTGHRRIARLDPMYPASDLVLTPRGTVAWIRPGSGTHDVVVVGPGRPVLTTLDAGPGVEPGSLAIAGRRVYWTNSGSPRSAELP